MTRGSSREWSNHGKSSKVPRKSSNSPEQARTAPEQRRTSPNSPRTMLNKPEQWWTTAINADQSPSNDEHSQKRRGFCRKCRLWRCGCHGRKSTMCRGLCQGWWKSWGARTMMRESRTMPNNDERLPEQSQTMMNIFLSLLRVMDGLSDMRWNFS